MVRGGCLVAGTLLLAACGNGDDLNAYGALDGERAPAAIAPARAMSPAAMSPAVSPNGMSIAPGVGGSSASDPDDDDDTPPVDDRTAPDPEACVTPRGVSGTPRTLSEAMILMNSLPKPASLACFLQALSRPLDVYMTSSDDSLQPAPGERSPRAFIVYEPLVMSIVFDGPAHVALELGYRTEERRSIKTEILFPLTTDVTDTNLFDEVEEGDSTRCGNCHTGEIRTIIPELPVTVYESDILEPFDAEEVDIDSLRAERLSCNPRLEPARCELLSAFFDFGTIQRAPNGIMFDL
jgi:hypothetical protein